MTNQEAIKYLRQIYPNGGHCWLDYQRIEAIDMAIKALEKKEVKMSKAEERALEVYPIAMSQYSDNCKEYDSNESDRLVFIEGYHQAEKDLTDISWIKEVSGVKELSRAKEEALKAYPPQSIAANYDTINRRDAFEYGYLKAEKDNELTWEDIKLLIDIIDSENLKPHLFDEIDYQEVLKRFKERKQQ